MVTQDQCHFIGLAAVLSELAKDGHNMSWQQEVSELLEFATKLVNQAETTNSWEGHVDRQGGSFDACEIIESSTWR
jgi:hypothetical protein